VADTGTILKRRPHSQRRCPHGRSTRPHPKANWIGTIEAADEGDAIEKAAKQFSMAWNGAERAQH
jgi:hypothetical protein